MRYIDPKKSDQLLNYSVLHIALHRPLNFQINKCGPTLLLTAECRYPRYVPRHRDLSRTPSQAIVRIIWWLLERHVVVAVWDEASYYHACSIFLSWLLWNIFLNNDNDETKVIGDAAALHARRMSHRQRKVMACRRWFWPRIMEHNWSSDEHVYTSACLMSHHEPSGQHASLLGMDANREAAEKIMYIAGFEPDKNRSEILNPIWFKLHKILSQAFGSIQRRALVADLLRRIRRHAPMDWNVLHCGRPMEIPTQCHLFTCCGFCVLPLYLPK